MNECLWCHKVLDKTRSTKRFCNTTCRVHFFDHNKSDIKGVDRTNESLYPDSVTAEETESLLNAWFKPIDYQQTVDFLNFLFKRPGYMFDIDTKNRVHSFKVVV